MHTTELTFAVAQAQGYAIHQGGPEDDDLNGKFWWSRHRERWAEVETSEGDWQTAAEAQADAIRAMQEELAAGQLIVA